MCKTLYLSGRILNGRSEFERREVENDAFSACFIVGTAVAVGSA